MPLRLSNETRHAMLGALPPSGATLRIYTGSQPASANDAATGTLLLEFDSTVHLSTPPSGGQVQLDSAYAPYQATAVASGTAGWARLTFSGGERIDGQVATSGAPFNISATSISSGDLIVLQSLVISLPAS